MKKVIERIVKSPGSPGTNDLWLTENNQLKVYDNEEWKTIAGGNDSGGDGGDDEPSGEITPAQGCAVLYDLTHNRFYDNTIETPLPDLFCINRDFYFSDTVDLDVPITINDMSLDRAYVMYEDGNNCLGVDDFSELDLQQVIQIMGENPGSYIGTGYILFFWDVDKIDYAASPMNMIGFHYDNMNYDYRIQSLFTSGSESESAWLPYLCKYEDKLYFSYLYTGD